jgi:Ser-tRNA(Ala) deacylase AlaX
LPRLNERLEKLVAADLAVYHRMIGHDDLRRLCPDLTYPVPKDKPLRVITVKDHRPIPCGGTHVSSTGSLGSSAVRKIRSRSGRIRFSYVVGVAVS